LEKIVVKKSKETGVNLMTIIIAITAASFITSALVISACAMSSRLSQQEGVEENYAAYEDPASVSAKPATPFSMN
jgi:hypothetical protein